MIYRGPSFLAVVLIGFFPPSCQQIVSFSPSSCVSLVELTERRGGGGGTKSHDSEKAWSSINHELSEIIKAYH
jgi:hypothetical protein